MRLYKLKVQGKAESFKVDAVRDTLEAPWRLLTETEKKRITGLSEDLSSISSPPKSKRMAAKAQRKLIEAFKAIGAVQRKGTSDVMEAFAEIANCLPMQIAFFSEVSAVL